MVTKHLPQKSSDRMRRLTRNTGKFLYIPCFKENVTFHHFFQPKGFSNHRSSRMTTVWNWWESAVPFQLPAILMLSDVFFQLNPLHCTWRHGGLALARAARAADALGHRGGAGRRQSLDGALDGAAEAWPRGTEQPRCDLPSGCTAQSPVSGYIVDIKWIYSGYIWWS